MIERPYGATGGVVALSKEQAMAGITVGVDGSDHSQQALAWAIREAGIRDAPLTVLAVHEVAASPWTGNPITYPADEAAAESIRRVAEETVQKAVREAGEPGPASVTVRAVSGLPARELIAASQSSDLVVVGARGGGGFARLLLGSVSQQVATHAACPVVVIRHE
jgi:nucleotide-binding universal stress UspA family protein